MDKEGLRPLHVIYSSIDQLATGPDIVKHLYGRRRGWGRTHVAGKTPLHLLCENKKRFESFSGEVCEMARMLLRKRGVSVGMVEKDGTTPLMLTTRNELWGLCDLLTEWGALNVNKKLLHA